VGIAEVVDVTSAKNDLRRNRWCINQEFRRFPDSSSRTLGYRGRPRFGKRSFL